MDVRARLGVLVGWAPVLGLSVGYALVVPRFEEVFLVIDVPLPTITQAVRAVGRLVEAGWFPILTGELVLLGALLLYPRARATHITVVVAAWSPLLTVPTTVFALFLPLVSLLQGIGKS